MEPWTTGLVGGLIGSVLTVLVSRLFDLWQKRQEHRYGLKATFFARKVHVAEHATAAYYTIGAALQSMAAALEGLAADEEDLNWSEVWAGYEPEFEKQLARVQEADWVSINAFPLYFDTPDSDFWQAERLRRIMRGFARVSGLIDAAQLWRQQMAIEDQQGTREQIAQHLDRLSHDLQSAVAELAAALEDISDFIATLVKTSRNEMRAFEA